jgi:hypothetical protein
LAGLRAGGLGHEVHAREHDHLGIDLHGLAGERQAVAHDIGHAVEDFRRLVIVGEDDGVPLALQRQDGVDIRREFRPFGWQDHRLHLVVELG